MKQLDLFAADEAEQNPPTLAVLSRDAPSDETRVELPEARKMAENASGAVLDRLPELVALVEAPEYVWSWLESYVKGH